MSDPYTELVTDSGAGLGAYGRIDRAEMIRRAVEHFHRQVEEGQQALSDIRAGRVRVYQQNGVYAARNRKEVS